MACKAYILAIAFGLVAVVSADSHISLYEHYYQQGQRVYLRSSGECVNVPEWFNDKASSCDTHNTCMTVFEHGNCQGGSFNYRPGNGHHGAMGEDGWNDNISSVRAC